jgi:hypothetical protein
MEFSLFPDPCSLWFQACDRIGELIFENDPVAFQTTISPQEFHPVAVHIFSFSPTNALACTWVEYLQVYKRHSFIFVQGSWTSDFQDTN